MFAVAGVGSLIAFAAALTRTDTAFAGRAYAAYGGIYIVASLGWLWRVAAETERNGPGWGGDRNRWSAGYRQLFGSPVSVSSVHICDLALFVPKPGDAVATIRHEEANSIASVQMRVTPMKSCECDRR